MIQIREKEYHWNKCKFDTSDMISVYPAFDETFILLIGHSDLVHILIHANQNGMILRR